jgi:hypothetical protein
VLISQPSLAKSEKACVKELINISKMDPGYLTPNLLQCGFIVAAGETKFLYNFKGTLKQMANGIEAYNVCRIVLDETNKFLAECEKDKK